MYEDSPAEGGEPERRKLYQVVKQRLFQEVVRPLLAEGGEIPPKKALAERYGVNVGTLDKALQELEVAGYIRKRVGIGTFVLGRPAKQAAIGIYWAPGPSHCSRNGDFGWVLNELLQQELMRRGIQFRHYADVRLRELRANPPVQLQEDAAAGKIGGLIALTAGESAKAWLKVLGLPCVALGYDFGWGTVAFDMLKTGADAALALAEKGCRKIEFLSSLVHEWTDVAPHRESVLGANRPLRAGMANALRPLGITAPEAWLTKDMLPERMRAEEHDLSVEEQGYELGKLLLRTRQPDGLAVYTDVFGSGVGRAIAEAGLRPGKDIQVVLLGNRELTVPHTEGFLRMDISVLEVAQNLARLLEGALLGQPPQELLLEYRLNETALADRPEDLACAGQH